MKKLDKQQMVNVEGGSGIGCTVAVAGFGLAVAGLFMTGAGAGVGAALLASQSYVVATIGLGTCFGAF